MTEDLTIVADARVRLGKRLAMVRAAAGFTQGRFAAETFYGRSSIANIEVGRQSAPRDFWMQCDKVLRTDGLLTREHDRIVRLRVEQHIQETSAPSPAIPAVAVTVDKVGARATTFLASGGLIAEAKDLHRVEQVAMPPGRFFTGTDLDVRVFPATVDGRVLVQVPPDYHQDPFIRRNRRGLVVGAVPACDTEQLYGLDSRHARRRLAGQAANARLLIPAAYLLDEVTIGLLWAAVNFDDALLGDDRILNDCQPHLGHLQGLARSSASRSWVTDLSATSAMWLGSDFCARHIMANIEQVSQVPAFWTREQHGEEASAWLLFAHKYTYLEQLSARFPAGMTRTFCIPQEAVSTSTSSERMLLLLVAALMESFSIRCLATSEPEYAAVDGFVLDQDRRAIVANWVGTEGLWFVDVTDSRSTVREYADAQQYVRSRSLIAADTPARRLQILAAYLGVDWPFVIRRCAEIAVYGLAGMVEPRSRLLSLVGADRACRFLGDLHTDSR